MMEMFAGIFIVFGENFLPKNTPALHSIKPTHNAGCDKILQKPKVFHQNSRTILNNYGIPHHVIYI